MEGGTRTSLVGTMDKWMGLKEISGWEIKTIGQVVEDRIHLINKAHFKVSEK